MNNRGLGRSGIDVSEISFGTVSLGKPYGIGIDSQEVMLSESLAVQLLQKAFDQGVNFYDTARSYGQSEALLGKAFKNNREQVIICSKSAHYHGKDEPLPSGKEIRKITDKSFQESLSALQTSYIDVYMLHNGDMETLCHPEVKEIFSDYKKNGVIRASGASVYSVEEATKAIEDGIWDVIQIPYNLMDQRMSKIIPLAQQRGVGVVVRSVLFKGILTNRGRDLHPELKRVERHRKAYDELLIAKFSMLSDLAIKFVLSHRDVSSVLVGIDKMKYLQDALKVADGNYLDEKTLSRAKKLAFPDPAFLDLPKWDAMSWLK